MSLQVITPDFVEICISNSSNEYVCMQKRFSKALTIIEFKGKLEMIVGGSSGSMTLQLLTSKGQHVCNLDNDDALLGSYPIETGMTVHVIADISQNIPNEAESLSMSTEEYNKRTNTLHNFLQNNKLGKYDEKYQKELEEQNRIKQIALEEKLESLKIGGRCLVQVSGQPSRKGTVLYKGDVEGLNGPYVGVKYDEPLGKNDGSFNGKRYFECAMKYGGFVKPLNVEAGDFPEDEFDLEEI